MIDQSIPYVYKILYVLAGNGEVAGIYRYYLWYRQNSV